MALTLTNNYYKPPRRVSDDWSDDFLKNQDALAALRKDVRLLIYLSAMSMDQIVNDERFSFALRLELHSFYYHNFDESAMVKGELPIPEWEAGRKKIIQKLFDYSHSVGYKRDEFGRLSAPRYLPLPSSLTTVGPDGLRPWTSLDVVPPSSSRSAESDGSSWNSMKGGTSNNSYGDAMGSAGSMQYLGFDSARHHYWEPYGSHHSEDSTTDHSRSASSITSTAEYAAMDREQLQQRKTPKPKAKGPQKHRCPNCIKTFPYLSKLNDHLMTHTKHKPHRCKECNKPFKRPREVDAHLKTVHYVPKAPGRRQEPIYKREEPSDDDLDFKISDTASYGNPAAQGENHGLDRARATSSSGYRPRAHATHGQFVENSSTTTLERREASPFPSKAATIKAIGSPETSSSKSEYYRACLFDGI